MFAHKSNLSFIMPNKSKLKLSQYSRAQSVPESSESSNSDILYGSIHHAFDEPSEKEESVEDGEIMQSKVRQSNEETV